MLGPHSYEDNNNMTPLEHGKCLQVLRLLSIVTLKDTTMNMNRALSTERLLKGQRQVAVY